MISKRMVLSVVFLVWWGPLGLFRKVWFLTFWPFASHDSNPYPDRSLIVRYFQNFTKVPFVKCFSGVAPVPHQVPSLFSSHGFIGADFWEGDATKHFSEKRRGFQ